MAWLLTLRFCCQKPYLHDGYWLFITVTSQRAQLRLKLMASRLFTQLFVHTDQMKHQSFASLAFTRAIQWWPVNSSHKWPVTPKMCPFDDVIMLCGESKANCWITITKGQCRTLFLMVIKPVELLETSWQSCDITVMQNVTLLTSTLTDYVMYRHHPSA